MLIFIILFFSFSAYVLYKISKRTGTNYGYWRFLIPVYNIQLICKIGGQKEIYPYILLGAGIILALFLQNNIIPNNILLFKGILWISCVFSSFFIAKAWGNIAEKLGRDKTVYSALFFLPPCLFVIKDINETIGITIIPIVMTNLTLVLLALPVLSLAFYKSPKDNPFRL